MRIVTSAKHIPHPRLRQARQAAGHRSAAPFARLVGIEEVTYRSYENGARSLTPAAAKKIAPALGDPSRTWLWLLFGNDPPPGAVEDAMVRAVIEEGRADAAARSNPNVAHLSEEPISRPRGPEDHPVPRPEYLLADAQKALADGDYGRARRLAAAFVRRMDALLKRTPEQPAP